MTVSGVFIWLGGGQTSEIDERHERTSYIITGIGVTLAALTSGTVTGSALALSGAEPVLIGTMALFTSLVSGVLGRAMAGAAPTARPELPAGTPVIGATLGRLAVPVLVGLLIAEVAATILFEDNVVRVLDQRAGMAVATEPTVRAARAELDHARADRTVLTETINTAQADIDDALIVARCEYNPAPQCPRNKITGVPGRGPEAHTANAMLDDARTRLAAAADRIDTLDRRITDRRRLLGDAEAAAFAEADRGIGARWAAMNEYTHTHMNALALRVINAVVFVLLALLPLILRRWRGETSLDRRRAARSVQHLSENQVHAKTPPAEVDAYRTDPSLRTEIVAPQFDSFENGELQLHQRQRTTVVATIAGLEIGLIEPLSSEKMQNRNHVDHRIASLAGNKPNKPVTGVAPSNTARALPTARSARQTETETSEPTPPDGLHLPLIGTVPFTDTAAELVGPHMPSFVARAVGCVTQSLRLAHRTLGGFEEVTVTLRRPQTAAAETHRLLTPAREHLETPTDLVGTTPVSETAPAQE